MSDTALALLRAGLLLALVLSSLPVVAWLDRWAARPPRTRIRVPLSPALPLANALKLIAKRAALPGRADALMTLVTAPLAVLASVLTLGAIPFAPPVITESGVLALDVLAGRASIGLLLGLWSLASLGIVATGYAGGNALALLGGLRVFLIRGLAIGVVGVAVLGVAFALGAGTVDELVRGQARAAGPLPHWGLLLNPVGFVCAVWALAIGSLRMERARPDERTDLVDPFAAESAGPFLFSHRLFETVELVAAASVLTGCFLGAWTWVGDETLVAAEPLTALGRALIFAGKWVLALLCLLFVRRALPRVRHEDALRTLMRLFVVGAAGTLAAMVIYAILAYV